ncbi:cell division protein FtsL [Mechercharimyces sp. CAU 1602]|uniref:cell division protein FtsL n=1 Tax=Mechercharimyces sp. CAU 1602 TaxID=2973933 RepID=UPI00216289EC|nr:cell division protein FtsL [Mechercharimyces sp. CAU 1602]MCS1350617.1 cell division protein FtsL [Mechercharimyces sp. CAU 1602]
MDRQFQGNTVLDPLDHPSQQPTKKQRLAQVRGLPRGEKVLYLFSVLVCVALALTVLSRHATVNEWNVKIHKKQQQVEEAQQLNQDLVTDKKELTRIERIQQFARTQGMIETDDMKRLPSAPSSDGQ